MNTTVTISNLYWNRNLREYFIHSYIWETIEQLIERCALPVSEVLDHLDEITEDVPIADVEAEVDTLILEDLASSWGLSLKD